MAKKSMKILKMLADQASEGNDSDSETGRIKWLLNEGFSPEEIEDACNWLKNLTINSDLCMAIRDMDGTFYTNRILNATESLKINEEAYGFLIKMKEMGLIDGELQEEIISVAMLSAEDEIGVEDIKGITAMLVFERSSGQWRSDILNIINDNWEKVYH